MSLARRTRVDRETGGGQASPMRTVARRRRRFGGSALSIGFLGFLVFVGTSATLPAQTTAQIGQWSPVMTWPFKAVHTHVLPTGTVMYWDSFDLGDNAQLWDPVTNVTTALPKSGVNIFCTGHSLLRDGRLFVTGGHLANFVGLPDALLFDPFANSWTAAASMNAGRWYPTNTTLPNGDVLVVSGQVDTTVGMNVLPQVYQVATGTWRDLTGAQLALPFYPFMYVTASGRVFMAGADQTTRYLDPSGTGSWTTVANNNYGTRNWASSVMYDDQKILVAGGTLCGPYAQCAPTATAEIIDLNAATPQWTYAASMTYPRKHHNATLLPDGTVLVTGGSKGTEDPNSTTVDPVNIAELWNPATNTWTTLATANSFRGYHSTAVLLPDARVLSAGGEITGPTAEIYSPPYLFNGARPTITSAPPYVQFGTSFFVGTPDATGITKATLIALSSVTHSFNATQRISRLTFTQAAGGLNITAPPNPNVAPPGYYMLFLLNAAGVPSIAKIMRLDTVAVAPPAAPSGLTATATSTQINLSWTDNSNNETGFKIERSPTNDIFTVIATVGANVTTYTDSGLPAGTTYYYRVRATNGAGDSIFSNTVSATTPFAGPTAPTALAAVPVSTSQINLSWTDNSNNETGFKIERAADGPAGTFTQIATVGANVTTYSNTGLPASTTYYYRVRATNGTGDSGYSNTATATTLSNTGTGPAPPSGLIATAISSSQINLTWIDNATNETGFTIERSTNGTTFTQIGSVGTNITSFANTGLLGGTTYYYRVAALGSATSAYSNVARATTPFVVGVQGPAAPTNLQAVISSNKKTVKKEVDLKWTDNATDETSFTIERSEDGVRFSQIGMVGANVTTYHDSGLKPGTKYFYRVRANNPNGSSAYSNTATVTTPQNNNTADLYLPLPVNGRLTSLVAQRPVHSNQLADEHARG